MSDIVTFAKGKTLRFDSIKIKGYRGRNFELKMNPTGNTVFEMDQNAGKTTTVYLLRWCFGHKQSEAKGKFKHMYDENAHVLDWNKEGKQECEISIRFHDDEHGFIFKRTTTGEYVRDNVDLIAENIILGRDVIGKVEDSLDIDNGADSKDGDEVIDYLNDRYRFEDCVDYFCFDGEKARELMQMAGNPQKLQVLLDGMNKRLTHPLLELYHMRLEDLRNQIHTKVESRLTDKVLRKQINELAEKNALLNAAVGKSKNLGDDIEAHRKLIEGYKTELEEFKKKIGETKSAKLREKYSYETQLITMQTDIENRRGKIISRGMEWLAVGLPEHINEIKANVKEVGGLPEPYKTDLIKICLRSDCCEICGRPLDDASRKRVKSLRELVASQDVQNFLSDPLAIDSTAFSPSSEYDAITSSISRYSGLMSKYLAVDLTQEDKELIAKRDNCQKESEIAEQKKMSLETEKSTFDVTAADLKKERDELTEKNSELKKYRGLDDQIAITSALIDEAQEKMRTKAIKIISDAVSAGVTRILGSEYSAVLTVERGFLLGQKGPKGVTYDPEVSGMGGRQILAYCIAEALTMVNPIFCDTPVGNIGTPRSSLAKHLAANHGQVVALCLPGELTNFAEYLNRAKPERIENREV